MKISDYGCPTLKKFCKLFHKYEMLTNWSAPEIWETQFNDNTTSISTDIEKGSSSRRNPRFDGKAAYLNHPQVDIYSLGIIIWELETGHEPYT